MSETSNIQAESLVSHADDSIAGKPDETAESHDIQIADTRSDSYITSRTGEHTARREHTAQPYAWAELFRFYMPLAVTSIMMMVTHSVVSNALARTLYPTIALAAYSASYAVNQVFEFPCYVLQRMCLAFTKGRRSLKKAARVSLMVLAAMVLCLVVISCTPLARTVFIGILGVSEQVYRMAVPSLQVLILGPVFAAINSVYQTPIVMKKQTGWLTVNGMARVAVMFLTAAVLPRLWPAGPVGAVILMLGMATESFLAITVSKKGIPPLEDEGPDEYIPSTPQILKFTLPLVMAAWIQTLGSPVITASLARTSNPDASLAGYQVAMSFYYIFAALNFNIYRLGLMYVRESVSFKQIKRFSVMLGSIALVCLLIGSIPQIGTWVFGTLIKAPAEVVPEALKALAFMSITPLMIAIAEFYGCIVMMHEHTIWVTMAKIGNLVVSSLVAVTLASVYPGLGSAIGSVALACGGSVEAFACYRMFFRLPNYQKYLKRV